MIYNQDDFDLDAISFDADPEHTCLVCGPWHVPGYMGRKGGGLRMCPACYGTGKQGTKQPSLPPDLFQVPKGRESYI